MQSVIKLENRVHEAGAVSYDVIKSNLRTRRAALICRFSGLARPERFKLQHFSVIAPLII